MQELFQVLVLIQVFVTVHELAHLGDYLGGHLYGVFLLLHDVVFLLLAFPHQDCIVHGEHLATLATLVGQELLDHLVVPALLLE